MLISITLSFHYAEYLQLVSAHVCFRVGSVVFIFRMVFSSRQRIHCRAHYLVNLVCGFSLSLLCYHISYPWPPSPHTQNVTERLVQ